MSLCFVCRVARAAARRLTRTPLAARRCAGGLLLSLLFAFAGAAPAQSSLDAAIAEQNAAFITQNAEVTSGIAVASAELAGLGAARADLEAMLHRIERRAEVHAIGVEFAQTIVQRLRLLPRSEQFDPRRDERAALITKASDANLRAERALYGLRDLDAAVAQRLQHARPPVLPGEQPELEAAVRVRLAEQRDLLTRLSDRQHEMVRQLREVDKAADELDREHDEARRRLLQILYWIPAAPGKQTIMELGPALAWTVSPANWVAAARAAAQEVSRRPLPTAIAVLAALVLLLARGRLQRALVSLAPDAVGHLRYGIGHALAALACTFALAAPGPLLLWTAADLLQSAPDTDLFALALSDACAVTAKLLLALSAFGWLLDRRSVAPRHFGADADALAFAAHALRRFSAVFVPLVFVTALNAMNYAPWTSRESLGRLLFVVAMLANAAFLAYLLRRRGPLMAPLLAKAPRSLAVGLHGFWMGALVMSALAIGGLAAAGYFVVAEYLFGRVLASLFFVLAAVVLYGLMALWVQVQRLHLTRRQSEAAARRTATGAAAEPGSEVAELPPPRVDIAAIGEQTRSLLDLAVTTLLLAGLWWVWREALSNLSLVGDYSLWTVTDTVNGAQVARALTLNRLLLALLTVAVTAVIVRNVGALLDIALLQRFDMQADATYAIKVIARYAIAAVGVLAVARILSIDWSDAQWLIAALGVGLGFGLQEIVANFVSGLIVLAERPIRIGDTVTVGEVTGTVAGIRARSTRVLDADNKEVIIPNKAFITERVTNWTLSNQTTRLLLKVGVACSADVAQVQQLLLQAVKSNADVMTTPAATVFFVGFGDSSLDFEIRAFVDSVDKRLRVKHEIYSAVERVLREHGIEVPFPTRDVNVRSVPSTTAVAPVPPAG